MKWILCMCACLCGFTSQREKVTYSGYNNFSHYRKSGKLTLFTYHFCHLLDIYLIYRSLETEMACGVCESNSMICYYYWHP